MQLKFIRFAFQLQGHEKSTYFYAMEAIAVMTSFYTFTCFCLAQGYMFCAVRENSKLIE